MKDDPVGVPHRAVVIVEGMFLHRDELFAQWDLSVFLHVPFTISASRMAQRDGTIPILITRRCPGTSRANASTSTSARLLSVRRM